MAALGFAECSMLSDDRSLHALRTWLDSWARIGHVAVGMHRQGYDLQLTQYDERGSRAPSISFTNSWVKSERGELETTRSSPCALLS
jgi:hypothetical protein